MSEEVAGWKMQLAWRGVLGPRLRGRGTPGHVADWRIGGRGDSWIRLEARSWCMGCEPVVRVEDRGTVSLAAFVRYDRPVAIPVRVLASRLHRALVPGLSRSAHGVLRARG